MERDGVEEAQLLPDAEPHRTEQGHGVGDGGAALGFVFSLAVRSECLAEVLLVEPQDAPRTISRPVEPFGPVARNAADVEDPAFCGRKPRAARERHGEPLVEDGIRIVAQRRLEQMGGRRPEQGEDDPSADDPGHEFVLCARSGNPVSVHPARIERPSRKRSEDFGGARVVELQEPFLARSGNGVARLPDRDCAGAIRAERFEKAEEVVP